MKLYLYDNEESPSVGFKTLWWLKMIASIIFITPFLAIAIWITILMAVGVFEVLTDTSGSFSGQEQCVPDPWGDC